MNQTLYFLQEQCDLMEEARKKNYNILIELAQEIHRSSKNFNKWIKLNKEFDLVNTRWNNESVCLSTLRKMMYEILNLSMMADINKIKS